VANSTRNKSQEEKTKINDPTGTIVEADKTIPTENDYCPDCRSNTTGNTESSMKQTGERTVQGFIATRYPLPDSDHRPIPANSAKGQIQTLITATIAPTTGPVPAE
jgi:hypothetical protein